MFLGLFYLDESYCGFDNGVDVFLCKVWLIWCTYAGVCLWVVGCLCFDVMAV